LRERERASTWERAKEKGSKRIGEGSDSGARENHVCLSLSPSLSLSHQACGDRECGESHQRSTDGTGEREREKENSTRG
jgi:hypothetical protein